MLGRTAVLMTHETEELRFGQLSNRFILSVTFNVRCQTKVQCNTNAKRHKKIRKSSVRHSWRSCFLKQLDGTRRLLISQGSAWQCPLTTPTRDDFKNFYAGIVCGFTADDSTQSTADYEIEEEIALAQSLTSARKRRSSIDRAWARCCRRRRWENLRMWTFRSSSCCVLETTPGKYYLHCLFSNL